MSNLSKKRIVQFIAYIGLIIILTAMIVAKIFPKTSYVCNLISSITALISTAFTAFLFAKGKRSPIFMVLYFLVVIVIIVMYFI